MITKILTITNPIKNGEIYKLGALSEPIVIETITSVAIVKLKIINLIFI